MTDAGYFRGTSSEQDHRFANKEKKLLKEMNHSPILGTKLQGSKVDLNSLKPWIEGKIKETLEKDDEILSELIYQLLKESEPDGRKMLLAITGFVDDHSKANKFMEDLWNKLIDLQNDSNGMNNKSVVDSKDDEQTKSGNTGDDVTEKTRLDGDHVDDNSKHSDKDNKSPRSSRTPTPPRRSISKSPTGQKLDEHSRGRPRRRLQDDDSPIEDSQSHASKDRKSNSRSRSRSNSRGDRSSKGQGSTSRSRSRSKSKASGSRSRSRSYSRSSSRSHSRSRSRSSSRSLRRRSRSPPSRPYRGRRTRSRSRSREYRPRSRSPRGRRGGYNNRGVYRGGAPFNYPDRRGRGGFGSFRRRPSPSWGRRRFSPRSPVRRRRTPSYSPRRRRSPLTHGGRRFSRSRSPPMMMTRDGPPSPRGHHPMRGHMDPIGTRHIHPHDMHRPIPPLARSPVRPPMDHRGYEGSLLPRRSPGPVMGRPDLPPPSQGFLPGPSGPSASSPSSGKKKHKKDKKHHRKHKKSKKRQSDSPDRKKKHKKHKKHKKSSKRHKS